MDSDMKAVGGLLLGLFLIMVIAAVVFIGSIYLKENACEITKDSSDTANNYLNGVCTNSTGSTVTVTAITQIGITEAAAITAIALLALVVLMKIFQVVIKSAKGFSGGGKM